MKKTTKTPNFLFKKRIFLVLFLFVLIFPIKSFSVSSLITFPDKIDTLQERKNIQIVLNRVIVPSLNLVVDGVIGRGTIRAIQVFQELKGLVPDGKVGPMTRLALENAQNISSIPGCAPGALFSTLNGQPCSGGNLPAGCLSSSGFSTITGLPCSTNNLPLGCSSTSGFSTITGLSCSGNIPQPQGGGGGGGRGRSGTDNTSPVISSFSILHNSNSLIVPISSLTATDNVSVTGYLVNESSTKPSAGASDWTSSAPTTYTFGSAGSKTLYAWAKDAAGNVSNSLNDSVTITLADTTLPVVTAFTIPTTATSLTVSISTFTATDNVGVMGYLVNESSAKPSAGASGWTSSAPTTYTFGSAGAKTLYAWAKDAAGNVSNSLNDSVTITIADTQKYLVENNIGHAEIIISPNAPNMVEIAANDLQLYIYKMTGVTLPISTTVNPAVTYKIYVGQSAYTDALGINDDDCEFDSFKMISGGNYLVLLGNDDVMNLPQPFTSGGSEINAVQAAWDSITGHLWETPYILQFKLHSNQLGIWEDDGRGSINAVYRFLYNQGVRWYYPGDIGEVVPTKNDILLPTVNTHIRPDFELRNMFMYNKQFAHGSVDFTKWQLRLGLNSGDDSLGISRGHGINNITDRSATRIAHPEYYAIWGGIRKNGSDGDLPKQDLCSTGLFNQNVDFIKKVFSHYNQVAENVMPADGYTQVSESSQECINKDTDWRGYEGRLSDYVFEYVNELAQSVYSIYPNKIISSNAYGANLLPPLYINQFSPNVAITIARWRSSFADPAKRTYYRNLTNDWLAKLPSGKLYTGDYYLHNMPERDNSAVPYYFPHIISDDLKFLKGKSSGEFIEVSTNDIPSLGWDSFASQSLNVYITSLLYWDADQNVDTLLNEYYNLFYGPASSKMKTLIEYSENNYINVPTDPSILVHIRQLANEAKAIAGNSIYGQRVDMVLGLVNSQYQGSDVTINSCQSLTSATTSYKLNTDVSSSGTCMNVTNDGITLDCQGHTITYGTAGGTDNHGINIDRQGLFNIKNCVIQNGNASSGNGIHVNISSTGGLIKDNNINITSTAGASPIYIIGSDSVDLDNNTLNGPGTGVQYLTTSNGEIKNNHISGGSNIGLYLYSASNNVLTNNTVSSVSSYGSEIYQSNNNTLTNNTISSTSGIGLWLYQSSDNNLVGNSVSSGSNTGLRVYGSSNGNTFSNQSASGGNYGIEVGTSNNNLFKDCSSVTGTNKDVFVYSGLNNILLSCPYNTEASGPTVGVLIRKWYLDVSVTKATGGVLAGAVVNSYDSTGALEATATTDSSGNARQELTEYIQTGLTKTLKTPHTITVSHNGYVTNSTVFNLTQTHNVVHNVVLSTTVLGASTYHFKENLKQGSIGNEVKELQNYLINMGYLNVNATGYFGPKTFDAVKRYQRANGLGADGIVGQKTREFLNR